MRALHQLLVALRVLATARRNRADLVKAMAGRPQLLAGTAAFEVALASAARVDPKLKLLAEMKVAALVGCEYCLDIGSALSRGHGLTEHQLRELHRYRDSDAFTDEERAAIEYAEALTVVPAVVPDDLVQRLRSFLTPAQLAELAVSITWENQRARLNQGLGVRPSGYSDGAFCLRPETVS